MSRVWLITLAVLFPTNGAACWMTGYVEDQFSPRDLIDNPGVAMLLLAVHLALGTLNVGVALLLLLAARRRAAPNPITLR